MDSSDTETKDCVKGQGKHNTELDSAVAVEAIPITKRYIIGIIDYSGIYKYPGPALDTHQRFLIHSLNTQRFPFDLAEPQHQPYPLRKLSPPFTSRPTMPRVLPQLHHGVGISETVALKKGGCADSEDIGLHHYNLAVRDLSTVIGKEHTGDPKQRLERLLAALLFMVDYEVRFGYSRHHLRLHLEGARSLYASYEKSIMDSERCGTVSTVDDGENEGDSHLSLLSSLLLLWISYIDAIGGQGLSSQSILSQISQSSLPSIKLERLYRRARISGRHCWGEEYPEDAILDDVENYRPLEFLHHGLLMRSRIWQLAVARHAGKDVTETPESLFEELMEIGERYQDLILTSRLSGVGQYRRVYGTIRCAASVYWADVLFHRLTLRKQQVPTKLHRTAVSSIMQIAYTDYGRETNTLAMQVWGLFMAGIETDDGIHRDWILERLAELNGMHFESRWTSDVMERLIRERKGIGEAGIDLMPLLTLECS
ncbi:hypothetical protein V491_02295 [Pseudogymnoascus sp. VKM F-3775]|nr:hypothetical protein V491_02295 [Pseudogymnoascus sp. VKM F-3775]